MALVWGPKKLRNKWVDALLSKPSSGQFSQREATHWRWLLPQKVATSIHMSRVILGLKILCGLESWVNPTLLLHRLVSKSLLHLSLGWTFDAEPDSPWPGRYSWSLFVHLVYLPTLVMGWRKVWVGREAHIWELHCIWFICLSCGFCLDSILLLTSRSICTSN